MSYSDEWTLVRNDPIRYGLDVPSWSLVTSGFGTLHNITLEKIGSSWKIIADNYTEGTLGLATESQSLIDSTAFKNELIKYPSSKQESANLNFAVSNQPKSRKLTTHTFDYAAAVSYALYWADKYNPSYQNWGPSNADCANFVSQCLLAGAYPTTSSWAPYTLNWINNTALRNWLISSGRGHDESSSMLGLADCVNYDWTNDGVLDHIAIVTNIVGSVPLVSCHTSWQRNVPYNSIYASSYMPSQTRKYTGTWLYYSA